MVVSWSLVFRAADAVTLTAVFLFQNVILNLFLIRDWTGSVLPYFWFLADFCILLMFYLTFYLVGCHFHREKKRNRRAEAAALQLHGIHEGSSVDGSSVASVVASASTSQQNQNNAAPPPRPTSPSSNNRSQRISEYNLTTGITWLHTLTNNFPMAYVSWLIYCTALIAKIVILFKHDIPQKLDKNDFLGPQMFKFAICLTTLVFSLIVAAHKNARSDPLRNAYLNNLCYRIALEILDSASFLSLLMPSESHLLTSYELENVILVLASINLFLPCMTLYKLCATDFGRRVSYPIETWYKFIHLALVDATFMGVRCYLWSMFSTDTSIFLIKNVYAIANFGRELPGEFKDLRTFCCVRKAEDEVELGGHGLRANNEDDGSADSIGDMRLQSLNKEPIGHGSNHNDHVTGYHWRKKEGSISTRGIHGSAQSSLVQVYAINTESTNGHVPSGGAAVDDSNSTLDNDADTTNLVGVEEEMSTPSVDRTTATQSEASSSLQAKTETPLRPTKSQP